MLLDEFGYFSYPGSCHVLVFMPACLNYFNTEEVWRSYSLKYEIPGSLHRTLQTLAREAKYLPSAILTNKAIFPLSY